MRQSFLFAVPSAVALRRVALAGLLAAVPAVAGCDVWRYFFGYWDEQPDDTNDSWLAMLPNGQPHTLEFTDPPGSISYQVEIMVNDEDLALWFVFHEDQAVATVDAVLFPWGVARFATDDGFADVEAEVADALVGEWDASASAEDVVTWTTLLISDCDVEDSGVRGAR